MLKYIFIYTFFTPILLMSISFENHNNKISLKKIFDSMSIENSDNDIGYKIQGFLQNKPDVKNIDFFIVIDSLKQKIKAKKIFDLLLYEGVDRSRIYIKIKNNNDKASSRLAIETIHYEAMPPQCSTKDIGCSNELNLAKQISYPKDSLGKSYISLDDMPSNIEIKQITDLYLGTKDSSDQKDASQNPHENK